MNNIKLKELEELGKTFLGKFLTPFFFYFFLIFFISFIIILNNFNRNLFNLFDNIYKTILYHINVNKANIVSISPYFTVGFVPGLVLFVFVVPLVVVPFVGLFVLPLVVVFVLTYLQTV